MRSITRILTLTLTMILVITSAFLHVYAEENDFNISDEELNSLINRAFDIYSFVYEGIPNPDYVDVHYLWEHGITDEYTEQASSEDGAYFTRLPENFRTEDQMREHYKKYFSADISDKLVKTSTVWIKNIKGQIVYMLDAKQYPDYSKADDPEIKLISVNGNTATYSYEIVHNIDPFDSEIVTKTFVIRSEGGGYKIVGGTFVSDLLNVKVNPNTGDTAAVLSAVAVISSALCIAVIIKRRKKYS